MRLPLKTVLVTTLLMTLQTGVAGQTLGFQGGFSLASFGGDGADGSDSRTALSFGGFFNVPVSNVLGVQVGAGFAQKGATGLGDVGGALEMDYLEIPLLLTFSPPTTGSVGFNLFLGPALDFTTGCTAIDNQTGVTLRFDCNDDSLKSVNWGAMVGAGLEIGLIGRISLVLDGFYNLGITNIYDIVGIDDDTKHRALSILAGLSLSVGG